MCGTCRPRVYPHVYPHAYPHAYPRVAVFLVWRLGCGMARTWAREQRAFIGAGTGMRTDMRAGHARRHMPMPPVRPPRRELHDRVRSMPTACPYACLSACLSACRRILGVATRMWMWDGQDLTREQRAFIGADTDMCKNACTRDAGGRVPPCPQLGTTTSTKSFATF